MTTKNLFQIDNLHGALLQIWSRLLNSSTLTIDDDFFESGGDSLLATEMTAELEQHFGKLVPPSVLFEKSSIRRLAEWLFETRGTPPKPVFWVGAVRDRATPLVYFHGDLEGGGLYVKSLARKFGPALSLIVVAPHGIGDETIPPSIQAMAADRLPAILEAQPQGPYRLAGFCVGGIVALETARLLMAEGHRVEMVVMIDSPAILSSKILMTSRDPISEAEDNSFSPGSVDALPDVNWDWYSNVLFSYSPKPLAVTLLLFASKFDARPWSGVSSDSALFESPGPHVDWLSKRADAFVEILMNRLQGGPYVNGEVISVPRSGVS
jgi:oxalate---CoA ligase